jgi:hypothetical protein
VASIGVRVQPAPAASNDTATLRANQSITINVLANDTSAGGTLNPASITIVVTPAHGTALVTNGQVVYTPTAGYSGLDTFQYSVQDNLGTVSNTATVSIEVTPPPASGKGGGGAISVFEIVTLGGMALMQIGARRRRAVLNADYGEARGG